MYAKRPVIAVKSGGPCESVSPLSLTSPSSSLSEATGFLCEPEPDQFAAAMDFVLSNPAIVKQLGSFFFFS
jgi:alpha-1,3/alpha-1,6-mannosyltransferase